MTLLQSLALHQQKTQTCWCLAQWSHAHLLRLGNSHLHRYITAVAGACSLMSPFLQLPCLEQLQQAALIVTGNSQQALRSSCMTSMGTGDQTIMIRVALPSIHEFSQSQPDPSSYSSGPLSLESNGLLPLAWLNQTDQILLCLQRPETFQRVQEDNCRPQYPHGVPFTVPEIQLQC